MKHEIAIQQMTHAVPVPKKKFLRQWASVALPATYACEVTLRIVNRDEMAMLNHTYRKKCGATNVLSFPMQFSHTLTAEAKLAIHPLGDVVLCADVIVQEIDEQHKAPDAHWAHLVVHGLLHLQGYDHQHHKEAVVMEALEATLLKQLGFNNPYEQGV